MKTMRDISHIIMAALLALVVYASILPASATVEEQNELPALSCGYNFGVATDQFKYYGLMVNLGDDKKNDAAAKEYCVGRAASFVTRCDKRTADYEARKCPSGCRLKLFENSSSDSSTFGFEQRQHPGEKDVDYKARRDAAIDKLIAQGDCGSSKAAQDGCRQLLNNGSFTIFCCLGSWSLDWAVYCD